MFWCLHNFVFYDKSFLALPGFEQVFIVKLYQSSVEKKAPQACTRCAQLLFQQWIVQYGTTISTTWLP